MSGENALISHSQIWMLVPVSEDINTFVCDVCTQVLELLSEGGEAPFDTMCLLRTLGQVRTDMVDRKQAQTVNGNAEKEISEIKGECDIRMTHSYLL